MHVRPAVPAATRGPVKLDLDWDALEVAVERNSPDTDSYLDLLSGRIITITTGDPEATLNRQQVSENIRNYLRVEPASSREQYRWMEKFVGSVTDEPLRERLIISIDGKGAFRRFKDVLLAYPAERERWFSYRAELLHWAIQKWMEKEQLAPKEPAPWGAPKPPPEDNVQLERPAPSGEGPGEILRRQAKELIDLVPAVELPAAIAFLDFLRERGVAELGRVRTIPVKRTAA
jgi:hypothetical protein